MTTEKKPRNTKSKQLKDTSKNKEELVFIDKEKDCTTCPEEKELNVSLGVINNSEWEIIIPLTNKYGLKDSEIDYIYNFYNRVFKQNKQRGCGKCFVNVCRALRARWEEMNK